MIDLEKLESLVKIKLTDEEKTKAIEYFEFWIKKFDKLENIDIGDTEPLINAVSLENIMREDIAVKIFTREAILENAPEQHDGYFVVPRIIE
jgi:aspartyl-tRNA(Asn)/glutamyl-tRNA(Gln) amidotransferase subunit C